MTAVIFGLYLHLPVALAVDVSDFAGMEGWSIVAVTQVDGEFEGCDFDKIIRFMDGTALRCGTFSYTYSFMPRAVIFAKGVSVKGKAFYAIKALIGDKIYNMQPLPEKKVTEKR